MNRPLVVLKFGGTSVTGRERWDRIAEVLRARLDEGVHPLVVCSAIAGVSDALEALLSAAARGDDVEGGIEALRARHVEQAAALAVDAAPALAELDEAARRLRGAALLREASPRTRARVLASGELAGTRLFAAFLEPMGCAWIDARTVLRGRTASGDRHFLAASCDHARAPAALPVAPLHLTQGFIAADDRGETVVLGRGGSDTSAALFAARLGATRLEIWTDVPGMFTANPRQVPSARLLRELDYDEAQEIASAGAKVLHPACIAPVRAHGIPLLIKDTGAPELPGTTIRRQPDAAPRVKAIATRRGIVLVSMDTLGMWQQVGFLADAFAAFKARGFSIDLVATSQSNVTVSLDPAANPLGDEALAGLLEDLSATCRARVISPTATVSLVGRGIRAILHRLGPVLERFADHRVHLVSQAASDLNLTFVVDEADADGLVRTLHALLFSDDDTLGPSWAELRGALPEVVPPWWVARRDDLLAEAGRGTPAYVYDGASLDSAVAELRGLGAVDRLLYAVKANHHDGLLRRLADAGIGFECVSPGEITKVRDVLGDVPVLYTPNFAPRGDYVTGFELGATVTLDCLHPLESWPELFAGREVFVRVDLGRGGGHHRHVVTAGKGSKFGVSLEDLDELCALVERAGAVVVGLHTHAGSGIRDAASWLERAGLLAGLSERFPALRVLDLGGGLGVPEKPGHTPLDLAELNAGLRRFKAAHPHLELWLEPGRFLVARAGVLLARVTQIKGKGERRFVGVDAGMHSLIRPALYGAWHRIVNLSRLGAPPVLVADVVGPICESGDVLGHDRPLPDSREGDVLLIDIAGAYGRVMASEYNLRGLPREVLLD